MTNRKIRIGVLGLGGVGGFIGAPLATFYHDHPEVEIVFICRGETLQQIKEHGLKLKTPHQELTAHPAMASDDAAEIRILDVVFLTTKSFSLVPVLEEYRAAISKETILIPLQNMVNARELVRKALPGAGKVLDGCIYVIANILEPGYIEHKGGPGKVFIGGADATAYEWLVKLLSQAGIDVTFSSNIAEVLWTKFLFISPVAAVTTAYQKTFGQLLEDELLLALLKELMREVKILAAANGVPLPEDAIETSQALLDRFPYSAKSSLQLDFERGNNTEKEYLIDFVVKESLDKGLNPSHYQIIKTKLAELEASE